MVKGVIFDFDGVLAESLDVKTNAFGRLFEREGKDVSRKVVEYHLQNSGVSRFEKFKYIYSDILKRPLTKRKFESLCSKFSEMVATEVINAEPVKGSMEFLKEEVAKLAFFVCSATPSEELCEIIKKRKMASYFKKVYGAPQSKKDIVSEIIREWGYAPSELVYVGDALSDHDAAVTNGVRFIARVTTDKPRIFNKIDCEKIKDLSSLKTLIYAPTPGKPLK